MRWSPSSSTAAAVSVGARGRRISCAPRPRDRDDFLRLNRASRRFYRGLVMPR